MVGVGGMTTTAGDDNGWLRRGDRIRKIPVTYIGYNSQMNQKCSI